MIDTSSSTDSAKPYSEPTAALMHDIARLSLEYAETRWQRLLLNVELRVRAIVRLAWMALLAIPPGMIAAYFAAHAVVQVLISWGMSPPAAYGTLAAIAAVMCGLAVYVAQRTADRWLK